MHASFACLDDALSLEFPDARVVVTNLAEHFPAVLPVPRRRTIDAELELTHTQRKSELALVDEQAPFNELRVTTCFGR